MAFPAVPLSERSKQVSYPIRDIVQAARRVQATGMKMHWFNIGDPNRFDFSPPPWVTAAIVSALGDSKYSAYAPSEGDPDLRAAIAKTEGLPADNVFITNGLSEGLYFIFQCLLNPGDNVLLPSPSYPMYVTLSRMLGGTDNLYRTDEKWYPDLDDMRKRINARTRAIAVINPNNPTGAVYPNSLRQAIVDLAGEHGLPLIADEIYDLMTFDAPQPPIHTLSKDVPVIRGCGLSKNYFYPGARVGYLSLHGPGLDGLQNALLRLCNARLSVNWEMQRGALAAFTHPPDHLPLAISKLRTRRDLMVRRLNEMPGIRTTVPQAAFYIFPNIWEGPWKTDTDFINDLLVHTGIVGVPGSGFSPILPGRFFRLVYLAPEDEIAGAMDQLEAFMKTRLANA